MAKRRFNINDYTQVKDRIKWYKEDNPDYRITTEIVATTENLDDVVVKAYIYKDAEDQANNLPHATGLAEELRDAGFVNETSHVENAECVPLDSEILTTVGFKKYNDVYPGDLVIAYDPTTEKLVPSKLITVNTFKDREVVSIDIGNVALVECTPDHKWVKSNGDLVPLDKLKGGEIIIAPVEPFNPISPFEVRDGLLLGRTVCGWEDDMAEDILRNYSIDESSELSAVVVGMSSEERGGFILGVADETDNHNRDYSRNVEDAYELACFLNGRKARFGNEGWGSRLQSSTTTIENSIDPETKVTDVWCPTTELGTWVMRQDGEIMITGNTSAIGRALANLDYHGSDKRPSAEEMEKVDRTSESRKPKAKPKPKPKATPKPKPKPKATVVSEDVGQDPVITKIQSFTVADELVEWFNDELSKLSSDGEEFRTFNNKYLEHVRDKASELY